MCFFVGGFLLILFIYLVTHTTGDEMLNAVMAPWALFLLLLLGAACFCCWVAFVGTLAE